MLQKVEVKTVKKVKYICVYGASSDLIDKAYLDESYVLGQELAKNKLAIVYGGGATGVMGKAAKGAKSAHGYILGIAPRYFDLEGVLFKECDEFVFTETMRERKGLLEEYADAVVVAPGGLGTMDEFFEIFTLRQVGQNTKPIVILNVCGCYDTLIKMIDEFIERKFADPSVRELFKVCTTADEAVRYIKDNL